MKIHYIEPGDNRINARRPFWKQYLIILAVVVVCCLGEVLIYQQTLLEHMEPWLMVLAGGSYVLFMVLIISIGAWAVSYLSFTKPLLEIGQAARKVASGDFTVRVHPQRKDDKKDELEVLIDDFNKMVEELSTIETLKTDFIANVSHEIKTPLAIIQSYSSALRKDDLSNKNKQEYILTILEASQRLSTLVTNVLKLNKIENQEIIKQETYSLDEQIRFCILALEDKFEEKEIELDIEMDEITIKSDQSLLEIVWNNLLTNAIKFTKQKGEIKISLIEKNGKAEVSIQDNGCGMHKETCHHIFDRFYQGDTSHAVEGNGLGLSLVKRIIDLIDGEIEVESELNKGTTFIIRLNL